MKKVLSFVFLISFFGIALCQQSRLNAFSVPYYKKTVKVKEYKPNVSLSVSYLDDNYYMSILSLRREDNYYGSGDIVFNIYVGDIRIKDFVVVDDTVYICGECRDTSGFFGFFDVETLFNAYWENGSGWHHTPSQISIFKNIATEPQGNVSTLDKLTEYMEPENGNRHVVCIGEAKTRGNRVVERDCLVDFVYDGCVWTYSAGVLPHTNTKSLEAIAFVPGILADFLVTVGFEVDSCLTVRLYDPSDVFSLPLSEKIHIFDDFSSTSLHYWWMRGIEITPAVNGNFVTASVWHNYKEFTTIKNRIHLARFNTASLYGNYVGSMNMSRELYSTSFPNITALHGLVFNGKKESYGLLFEAEQSVAESGNSRSFFFELDGTMENVRYCLRADGYGNANDLNLRGIDLFDSNNKYIMAGYCLPDNYHKIDHLIETSHHSSLCLPSVEYTLNKLEPVKQRNDKVRYSVLIERVAMEQLQTVFESTGVYRICPEREDTDE